MITYESFFCGLCTYMCISNVCISFIIFYRFSPLGVFLCGFVDYFWKCGYLLYVRHRMEKMKSLNCLIDPKLFCKRQTIYKLENIGSISTALNNPIHKSTLKCTEICWRFSKGKSLYMLFATVNSWDKPRR
jgi:hypothetical protein